VTGTQNVSGEVNHRKKEELRRIERGKEHTGARQTLKTHRYTSCRQARNTLGVNELHPVFCISLWHRGLASMVHSLSPAIASPKNIALVMPVPLHKLRSISIVSGVRGKHQSIRAQQAAFARCECRVTSQVNVWIIVRPHGANHTTFIKTLHIKLWILDPLSSYYFPFAKAITPSTPTCPHALQHTTKHESNPLSHYTKADPGCPLTACAFGYGMLCR